jgi:outer membrane protein assembly factor BamB
MSREEDPNRHQERRHGSPTMEQSLPREPEPSAQQRFDRRTFVALVGGIVVASIEAKAGGAFPILRAADTWELPAHDLAATRHGGRIAGTLVNWRADLEGGVAGAPAIVGGEVFAASIGGVVASFDLLTGRARWRRHFPTPVYGSGRSARRLGYFGGVAVADGRVFAASDRVVSLDAGTGRTIWETAPLRTSTSDDYFWGPPVVARGVVLVGSGSGAELPTARGRLSAYSLRDGSLVWSTPTVPAGANGGGIIAPASVDLRANLAYVATGSPYRAVPGRNPGTGSLLALRLDNGAIVWSDQIYPADKHGFDFNSAPVILGRILVAASKDGFRAWDRVTRRRLWHRRLTPALSKKGGVAGPTNGPEGGPVATDGVRIYVLSNDAASNSCLAAALAPATGHVLWRQRLPSFSFAAPAIAGDRLFATGADGILRGLATGTGRLVAAVRLGAPSTGAPAVAGGRLVVGAGAEPFLPGHLLVCIGPHPARG